MQSVAKMRSTFIPNNGSKEDIYLMNYGCEPWCSLFGIVDTSLRQKPVDYSVFISQYSLLFEEKELLITEEDLKIALAITPTLDKGAYQIGKPWPFTWHQLRRTGAVNMLSSDLISDATLQLLLKHMSPIMTLLYAHGHTTLNLSEEVQGLIVNALYETMGSEIANLHSERFISPHGESQKLAVLSSVASPKPVFLISESDAIHYEKAAREHQINFRVTAVGACMKNGHCDGDGFSSLSDCAGGDGRAPCSNSLFDRNRASANKVRLEMTIKQIESTQVDTPRYRHLEQERRGLENYFAYIR